MFEFIITGVVQGVGFRPYIYKQCQNYGLNGYIQNIGTGVKIVINNRKLLQIILKSPPPLARIDIIKIHRYNNPETYSNFTIKQSTGNGFAEIPADLFLCSECNDELHDPSNRRYQYFFTTCTNCGPRYSMTYKNPYDRATTSMNEFAMCQQCHTEYANPFDRRYHAQTIACPTCGPTLTLIKNSNTDHSIIAKNIHAITQTATLLAKGEIVAIKGVGGFHLACNTDPKTVRKLRVLTGRKHKPYAVMCKDIEMAQRIATITDIEKELLLSGVRPIVAVQKKQPLSSITELQSIGIMMPYTALHFLLFDYVNEPILMTSANMPGEPITTETSQQWVSYILTHDRKIVNAIDDSVIKVIVRTPLLLRRSRGFAPQSIAIHTQRKQTILAMGAEMNNTFAMFDSGRIYMSPYIGNTAHWTVFQTYQETIKKYITLTHTVPKILLGDLHPNYNTSTYGKTLARQWNIPFISVQHHRAHAFSAAIEHNLDNFIAIVCDGTGYGDDGAMWGGEIFYNEKRIGHLEYQLQPGGDAATDHPIHMVFSILSKIIDVRDIRLLLGSQLTNQQFLLLQTTLEKRINCPFTSSCGRILDAAACLLRVCNNRDYEGRAAMLLDESATTPYALSPVIANNILQTTPLFTYLITHIHKDPKRLAATVFQYLSEGLLDIARQTGGNITFTGGCAYSKYMTTFMLKNGVKINSHIPSGDGGISSGQIGWYLANSG